MSTGAVLNHTTPLNRPAGIVLLVDDEQEVLDALRRTLWAGGIEEVETCCDSRRVGEILASRPVSLMLLDLIMPHVGGEQVLAAVSASHPELPVIVLTAEQDARTAVRCMKLGAVDYLLKPVEPMELMAAVTKALQHGEALAENRALRESFMRGRPGRTDAFAEILTTDAGMLRMFSFVEAVAPGSQPVLITGESGTGKELVARALHTASGRTGSFVAVNVAGLDDTVFSDTLFGHKAGAFTGALKDRAGMIERAANGTLFLDEIGDLSEASQVKLLRLLQEREYYPLGSDRPQRMTARVVAATHKDPAKLRQDLFYRLRAYRVQIPALRERPGDLDALLRHFVQLAAKDLGRSAPALPPGLATYLRQHPFPGNVRELQAMTFEALARHPGMTTLPLEAFVSQTSVGGSTEVEGVPPPAEPPASASSIIFPQAMPTLDEVESAAIAEALRRTENNRSAAAKLLGVSRNRLKRNLPEELAASDSDNAGAN